MIPTRFSPSAHPPDFGGRYQDRVAVVTGASSGLGAQLSIDLARAGATVWGLARNTERLEKLATDLRTFTPGSGTLTCDVADTDALRRALGGVAAAHGPVDLLVNNAAQDPGRAADRHHRAGFPPHLRRELLRAGRRHPGRPARHARARERHCRQRLLRRGSPALPGPGAYPSSKAALSAFTESTSFRLGPKGVHVHVVYPAFMATELGLGALERGLRRPPRLTTRSVETVSHRILAQAGGPALEISVAGLIDAAMVFRFLLPGTYHRLRRHW